MQLDRLRIQFAGLFELVVWGWVGVVVAPRGQNRKMSITPISVRERQRENPPTRLHFSRTNSPCSALLPSSFSLLASSIVACCV